MYRVPGRSWRYVRVFGDRAKWDPGCVRGVGAEEDHRTQAELISSISWEGVGQAHIVRDSSHAVCGAAVLQDWDQTTVEWFSDSKETDIALPEYKLTFLWLDKTLACAVDQVRGGFSCVWEGRNRSCGGAHAAPAVWHHKTPACAVD
jgi:hypothetical protein